MPLTATVYLESESMVTVYEPRVSWFLAIIRYVSNKHEQTGQQELRVLHSVLTFFGFFFFNPRSDALDP